jgi:membrane protease YdiL (CAAX protease family)
MNLKHIFWNDIPELRAGWQIAVFVLALAVASLIVVVPLIALAKVQDAMVINVALGVALLAATGLVTRFVNRKPLTAVGLAINKHAMRQLGIGCLLGWLMLTAIFGIEYAQDHVKVAAAEISFAEGVQTFLVSLVFFAVAAMNEELLFRGYPFQALMRGIGFVPAAVVTGFLFGAAHLNNPNANVFGFINTVLVAWLFCFAYWRTRSLWLPFGIHFSWNFAQTTIYGFPTSGVHFSQYELTRLTQFGSEWVTGGAYGPEGGALATLVIVLCGVYVYFSRSLHPHPATPTLEREGETIRFVIERSGQPA